MRAIISVYDKTGLADFAKGLSQLGFDDSARKLKFEIETAKGIELCLTTPEDML